VVTDGADDVVEGEKSNFTSVSLNIAEENKRER